MPAPCSDTLRLDYEQTLQTYRQLVEVRFKLLAFVPTVSGAAFVLLTATDIGKGEAVVLAVVGLVFSIAVVLYDGRNTQFHNSAIGRAKELEKLLGLPAVGGDTDRGLFGSRDEAPLRHVFGLPVRHDVALALVYSATVGGWSAVLLDVSDAHPAAWISVGALVGALCLAQLLWHDGAPGWLIADVRRRQVEEPLFVIRDDVAVERTRDELLHDFREADDLEERPETAYDRRGRRLTLSTRYRGLGEAVARDRRRRNRVLVVRPWRERDVTALRRALIRSLGATPDRREASLEELIAAYMGPPATAADDASAPTG